MIPLKMDELICRMSLVISTDLSFSRGKNTQAMAHFIVGNSKTSQSFWSGESIPHNLYGCSSLHLWSLQLFLSSARKGYYPQALSMASQKHVVGHCVKLDLGLDGPPV